MSVERQSCLIKAKSYVLRFLKDSSLREVVDSYCTPKDWTILNTCNYERNQDGGLLMCMFDSVNNVGSSCATLVQRLKVVPFLTMDTLMPFLKHCQRDIDQNRCSGFKVCLFITLSLEVYLFTSCYSQLFMHHNFFKYFINLFN